MYLPTFIIAVVILSLLVAFVYFYLFARGGQGLYMRYWGLSWLFYSMSLIFFILNISNPSIFFMGFRKVFDLYNLIFLLFGAYSFMHSPIPRFWHRFSLYLIIWTVIGVLYRFDALSVYLPLIAYQVIVTTVLCVIVLSRWDLGPFEKALSVSVFFIWGIGKSMLSFLEVANYEASSLYLIEIIFSNVLNFSIFVIYLRRAQSQVAFADRLYRIIAENASDVIFYYTLKPQPAFRYITPSIEEMTGYTPNEFYLDPKFYYMLVVPEQVNEIEQVFQAKQDGKEPYKRVFQLNHKSGLKLWVEFNLSTLIENGEPIAIEGFMRDITPLKEAERELLSSKQSRQLLLSYISHELKTPVTSILGYVNALKDGTLRSEAEISKAVDIIFTKSQTLERLISDLFQLSKLETGQFSFHFMRVNALELSKDLINHHLLDIRTAGLTPEYRIQSKAISDTYLIVDPERIDQVFSNIITNAIKHSKENGKISIKIGLDPEAKEYYVAISDTGTGIVKEDLPYIFDRFYRGSSVTLQKREPSTGLGLTISKEIITAHKGQITAKSHPEKGSTFRFTIPIYIDEELEGVLDA